MKLNLIIFLLLTGLSITTYAQKKYVDTTYDISLVSPENWKVNAFIPFDQKTDPNTHKHLNRNGTKAIFAYILITTFNKYEINTYDGVNSTLNFGVGSKKQESFVKYQNYLSIYIDRIRNLFPDFTIAEKPQQVLVDTIPSYYFSGNYTIKGGDRPLEVTKRILIIPHGPYLFLVDYVGDKNNVEDSKTFASFVQSLKFGL
jgi:hypothetical protein